MVPIWATLALNTRPAQAGVTCPRDWRAAAGWETATGPAPGFAQPGRPDTRQTPALARGRGLLKAFTCLYARASLAITRARFGESSKDSPTRFGRSVQGRLQVLRL
jgi:hypothetical protein